MRTRNETQETGIILLFPQSENAGSGGKQGWLFMALAHFFLCSALHPPQAHASSLPILYLVSYFQSYPFNSYPHLSIIWGLPNLQASPGNQTQSLLLLVVPKGKLTSPFVLRILLLIIGEINNKELQSPLS